jgi:hypothetical protein
MTDRAFTPTRMMTRSVLTGLAVLSLIGCANPAEPMACDGNPKCKADTQPSPTSLKLQQAPPPPLVTKSGRRAV